MSFQRYGDKYSSVIESAIKNVDVKALNLRRNMMTA